jgi:hypothetical protein
MLSFDVSLRRVGFDVFVFRRLGDLFGFRICGLGSFGAVEEVSRSPSPNGYYSKHHAAVDFGVELLSQSKVGRIHMDINLFFQGYPSRLEAGKYPGAQRWCGQTGRFRTGKVC